MAQKRYLFCGIGGSGMLPLAMLMRRGGAEVVGSDRSFDQGKSADKQAFLRSEGIALFPQNGSGMTSVDQILVTSTAVEAVIPDVVKAQEIGAQHIHRADLLSSLFNSATNPVAIAGTSGKSTITAMLGWILHVAGREPTIVNGAVMANFRNETSAFASSVYGAGPDFVAEVDESDGSIAHYRPAVAILSNITIDHMPIPKLKALFGDYLGHAKMVVANLDNPHVAELAAAITDKPVATFSMHNPAATIWATKDASGAIILNGQDGSTLPLNLKVFGDYNVSNALAAIAAAELLGVTRGDAVSALAQFTGVARRMEPVGQPHGVDVYDDFGHNPDKIAASLSALRERYTRVLAMFQPHGYNPMHVMEADLVDAFQTGLRETDHLWMTEPVYFGGTVTRTPIVQQILDQIGTTKASHLSDRGDFPALIATIAQPGDCVVIMGARDDSLTDVARGVVAAIVSQKPQTAA